MVKNYDITLSEEEADLVRQCLNLGIVLLCQELAKRGVSGVEEANKKLRDLACVAKKLEDKT